MLEPLFQLSCRPEDIPETPTQVFSCEFWEIFKNIFFVENLPATASLHYATLFTNTDTSSVCNCSLIHSFNNSVQNLSRFFRLRNCSEALLTTFQANFLFLYPLKINILIVYLILLNFLTYLCYNKRF